MKAAASRSIPLSLLLGLAVVVPMSAAEKAHLSTSSCEPEPSGMMFCFASEIDTRTTESERKRNEKVSATAHGTRTDSAGTVVWAYDLVLDQKGLIEDTEIGPVFAKLDVHQVEQISEFGVVRCVVTDFVSHNGVEKVNEVVTTDGPCW